MGIIGGVQFIIQNTEKQFDIIMQHRLPFISHLRPLMFDLFSTLSHEFSMYFFLLRIELRKELLF